MTNPLRDYFMADLNKLSERYDNHTGCSFCTLQMLLRAVDSYWGDLAAVMSPQELWMALDEHGIRYRGGPLVNIEAPDEPVHD